jgi:oxygen-independent coproporphyrinogen III oxidase
VNELQVTPELLARYDKPGPRYTSYPTAPQFSTEFGPESYAERLKMANARSGEPLSVYCHIPFCDHRCLYCGCHVIITQRDDVVEKYLNYMKREVDRVTSHMPARRDVVQLHWGGGTPTHLTPDQMEELYAHLLSRFHLLPEAEVAMEVDPRVTTSAHIAAMKRLGFNRLSLGVQDFTPAVQEAVERNQTYEETAALIEEARRAGFTEFNLDLIYGLPLQTVDTFRATVERVVGLRPGRVAVYSYAHVPWIRPQQKRIHEEDLPRPETKFALFAAANEIFTAAGYQRIGMDHFALPEDELARARDRGALTRNFMGYTVRQGTDLVAFGVSGIGEVGGAFVQNVKKLSDYYRVLDTEHLPVDRGYVLNEDDRIRRFVILSLMCNFEVDLDLLRARFGVDYDAYFAPEIGRLESTIEPGFLRRTPQKLAVTPLGSLFIRNICMVFDRYLVPSAEKPIYSRTI